LIPTISQSSIASSSVTTGVNLTSVSITKKSSSIGEASSPKRAQRRPNRCVALRKRQEKEQQIWRRLFLLMDLDGNGKIDQNELLWAFKRDEGIHTVAANSELLKVAMKDPNLFFEQLGGSSVGSISNSTVVNSNPTNPTDSVWEITWECFFTFCEQKYNEMITQIAHEEQVQEENEARKALKLTEKQEEALMLETEESLARQVFALVDFDMNGILDPEEMRRALENNPDVKELVCRSKSLKPLVEEATFMTAFLQMETQNPSGMSIEEFVLFCTELASIAKLNGLA
jgi:Ca2+-binding EF-hand superfamily protein